MKIACLISSLRLGGAERQLIGLAEILVGLGHDVQVVTYRPGNFYESEAAGKGLEHTVLKSRDTAGIIRGIAALNADLVISFMTGANLKACLAKRLNRAMKLVVSERNCNTSFHFHDWLRFATYHHFADMVVCNNYSQEAFIRRYFPRLAPKLVTIPNFVDTERFCPPGDERRFTRATNRIVVASRISPRKNTIGLIEAANILLESGVDNFVIDWYGVNGESRYLAKCRKLMEKYRLEKYFHLLPATEDIAQIYRDADFFCLPSFYEGTSNAIAEALASGLPVACGRVSDNVRYVQPWKNGFLFDPHDSIQMACELKGMIRTTPEMRRTMNLHSREIVEKWLNKKIFIAEYLKIITTFES